MNVIRRISERLKKHMLVFIAIPLILGVAGWLMPVVHGSSTYQASATVALGKYWNYDLNTPEPVTQLLSNGPFYQKNLPDLWNSQQQNLLSHINVTSLKGNLVQVTYTGVSKTEAADTANRIANAFLKNDQEQYQKRMALTEQSIQAVTQSKTNESSAVDKQRFLYQLGSDKIKMKPAELLEAAQPGVIKGTSSFTPKKRAVLGVVLGITLIFVWVAFPEFVREREGRR